MQWQYRETVLALCTFGFFVTFYARVAVSQVVPFITDGFAITNFQIGIALSGMWIAYGLSQYPSGKLADRFGAKRIILISVGGTALLSVGAAISPVFALFTVAVVGLGVVAGLHYTVAAGLLSRAYRDLGTAIGIHALGGPAAGLVAPIVSAWIAVRFGWRPAVAFVGVFAIPIFLLFLWKVRPTRPRRPKELRDGHEPVESFIDIFSRPTIAFAALIGIIAMFVLNGLVSFLPTFLIEHHAYSPTLAGIVFALYFIIGGGAQVAIGALSDRFDRDAVIAVCFGLGAAGLFTAIVGPALGTVLLAVVLFGTGGAFFVALEPKVISSLARHERNAGFGVFRTVYLVGGSTGALGVGAMADSIGWDATFAVLGMLFIAALGLVVLNRVIGTRY